MFFKYKYYLFFGVFCFFCLEYIYDNKIVVKMDGNFSFIFFSFFIGISSGVNKENEIWFVEVIV